MAAKRSLPVLDWLFVAEPCEIDWDDMQGGERVRHCARCDKPVYDIAAMTRDEADRFVRERAGRACIRMVRADDGRVVTAEDNDVDIRGSARATVTGERWARRTRIPRTALDLIGLRGLVMRATFASGAFRSPAPVSSAQRG